MEHEKFEEAARIGAKICLYKSYIEDLNNRFICAKDKSDISLCRSYQEGVRNFFAHVPIPNADWIDDIALQLRRHYELQLEELEQQFKEL